MTHLRVPPGRAGRLWLRHRLAIAEHGLSMLEQKVMLLDREEIRLRSHRDETRRGWETCCREARTWQQRATLIGGRRAIRLAASDQPADVDITWTTTAGVRYPNSVECRLPDDENAVITGTAVACARFSHAAAIVAAARCAAAEAALAAVENEAAATRLRAQAIRRRRIPELRAAAARVELALEEQERMDNVRHRRAVPARSRPSSASVEWP